MFYVKHHQDEVTILNSKCPTAVLMDRLHKLGGLTPNLGADLMSIGAPGAPIDHKNAQAMSLHDKIEANGSAIYANTFINPRAVYVLLSSQEDEDGIRTLKPVWKSATGDESDKLAALLDSKAADEKKKLGSKKSKK